MKILITGANGYIGSKVTEYLVNHTKHEIIACDNNDSNIKHLIKVKVVDLFSIENPYFYFDKPDLCIHLAWRDGFVHDSLNHINDLPKHYDFLRKLIENGLANLSVMGTMHEIGYWEGAINENTPTNPLSLYGVSKNTLRHLIEILKSKYNFDFKWLRAFYIFSNDEYGQSVFSKIIRANKAGQDTFPLTSGKNKYDFIDVRELSMQISLAAIQSSITGIINVCSGNPISLKDKIEEFIKENNLHIKMEYGKYPERLYDSPIIYGDKTKITQILNMMEKST